MTSKDRASFRPSRPGCARELADRVSEVSGLPVDDGCDGAVHGEQVPVRPVAVAEHPARRRRNGERKRGAAGIPIRADDQLVVRRGRQSGGRPQRMQSTHQRSRGPEAVASRVRIARVQAIPGHVRHQDGTGPHLDDLGNRKAGAGEGAQGEHFGVMAFHIRQALLDEGPALPLHQPYVARRSLPHAAILPAAPCRTRPSCQPLPAARGHPASRTRAASAGVRP
ncbi:hypothetical protein NQ152_11525 [Microbacterium sp. zg.B48]|nr:hypothetical protein [Microbacterium sp. zg.B48]MCR2764132.1 hypothetical protein [Microbacterium sp. zg.B48]MCR2809001.1 hypothetical protein [Microbacterium sp. zg.B185]